MEDLDAASPNPDIPVSRDPPAEESLRCFVDPLLDAGTLRKDPAPGKLRETIFSFAPFCEGALSRLLEFTKLDTEVGHLGANADLSGWLCNAGLSGILRYDVRTESLYTTNTIVFDVVVAVNNEKITTLAHAFHVEDYGTRQYDRNTRARVLLLKF